MFEVLLIIVASGFAIKFWLQRDGVRKMIQSKDGIIKELEQEIKSLSRFSEVRDATEAAQKVRAEAEDALKSAQVEVRNILNIANRQAKETIETAQRETDQLRKDTRLDAKAKREKAEALLDKR